MLIRRFFAFVISAFLIFFPAYSYATTSVGGWTALDTITAGATNTINATKTAGGKVLNSAITIAPQAGKVGKHLIKGGGSAALAFAMVELADGAIDWVLDPANNAVKYKKPIDDTVAGTGMYYWYGTYGSAFASSTADGAGRKTALESCKRNNFSNCSVTTVLTSETAAQWTLTYNSGSTLKGSVNRYNNPAYDPANPDGDYKSIPIDTVAAQVISNAEAGHPDSQEAVKATALEGFAAGEHDAALDAAAVPDTGVENPTDPAEPVDPAAPFDPSSIIAAINSLKPMLAGILSSMTGFFDWVKAPVPPDDEEKKDVPFATTGDVGLDSVDRYEQRIDFSGQCPVNDFSFTMMGVTYAKPIPYYHFCGFLEQIAPWLLAMCYLGTAYFVVENI